MSKPQFYQSPNAVLPPVAHAIRLRSSLAFFALLAAAVLLVAWRSFHITSETIGVPFTYQEGDVVVVLMHIKGLLQDGWPLTVSHLSAPFTYPAAAFPHMTSTDWLVMKGISIFTRDPGVILNSFFLFTLVASAWTSSYAAYQLGLSRAFSFTLGILYAFLPFALIRNVHHLNLVYYMVPLLGLLAIIIASRGEGIRQLRQATFVGLAACVAQGFDYVYFSFFAALLFGVAMLLAWRKSEWKASCKLPLLAIALVCIATAANLYPAYRTWQQDGLPPEMGYKSVAEAEVYGAKLRRMLAPHPDNPVRPLARYAKKDTAANFPLENENITARLGLFAGFGLLIALFSLLRTQAGAAQPARSVHVLATATLLVITVGGIGALINLIGTADIRGYNRFSVYLAFFALAAAGLWLQDRLAGRQGWRRIAIFALAGGFMVFSLYDQLLDARFFVARQPHNLQRIHDEKNAVRHLEQTLPAEAAVLQLPLTGYPPIYNFHRMLSYDHGRPAIWSTRLRWSWPSLSQQHRDWQNRLRALKGNAFLRGAALSGFDAIWIDRDAYEDGGEKLIASLLDDKVKPIDIGSTRYAVLDLRPFRAALKAAMSDASYREQAKLLLGDGTTVGWEKGFHQEEKNADGRTFHWASNRANLVLRNAGDNPSSVCLSFTLTAPHAGTMEIDGGNAPVKVNVSDKPQPVRLAVTVEPGQPHRVSFIGGMPRFNVPSDPRELYFYVMDFAMTPQNCSNGT